MLRRVWAVGGLAALALCVGVGSARADTAFQLGAFEDVQTLTLGFGGAADTTLVRGGYHHHHGRHHHGHFHHGYYHHYHRGFYARSHYYPFAYGGYYPAYRYYPPRYSTFSFGFSLYRPAYYYAAPAYYYDFCPIGSSIMPYATSLGAPIAPSAYVAPALLPLPTAVPYRYDGGPANPVPLPPADPVPSAVPPPSVPLEGRSVSLPAKQPTRFAYPAYGESPARTGFAEERTVLLQSPAAPARGR